MFFINFQNKYIAVYRLYNYRYVAYIIGICHVVKFRVFKCSLGYEKRSFYKRCSLYIEKLAEFYQKKSPYNSVLCAYFVIRPEGLVIKKFDISSVELRFTAVSLIRPTVY